MFRNISTKLLCFIISLMLLCSFSSTFAANTNLSSYKGKWVIVAYWADWCHFCMSEMPELNAYYNRHKDKVMVLGVNYDELPQNTLNKFAKRKGWNFPMMSYFPIHEYSSARIDHIPMTFVFDPKHTLRKILEGPQTQSSLGRATGIR